LLLVQCLRSVRGKFHPELEVEMAVSRATVPIELYERYGLKTRNSLLLTAVWGAAFLIVGYLFLQIIHGQQSNVETRLISWEVSSPTTVEITWNVSQSSNQPLVCIIRAQDSQQFDVGFAIFEASDPAKVSQFTQTLRTNKGAYAVINPTCEQNVSALTGPHFRPGLLPPAQNSPLFAPWQWNS